MLLTVDEERRFMGIIHPDKRDNYWYTHLTMVQKFLQQYLAGLGRLSSALFFKKWKRCKERFLLMIVEKL
jgi:hypothetical protein